MAIVIELGGPAPQWLVSPLAELGWAWHGLACPAGHQLAVFPAGIRARLSGWAFAVSAVRASVFADPGLLPGPSFADQLNALRRMPAGDFTAGLLRPLLRVRGRPAAADRAGLLSLARARGPAVLDVVRALTHEPEEARETFTGLLAEAWEAFGPAWEATGPVLAAEAARRAALSPRQALAGLSPALTLDVPGARLTADKVQNKRLVTAGRGLVLTPTRYGAPHLTVSDEPGRPVVVHYPVPAPARAAGSRETVRRLEVLGHPARLEICRAIAVEPRSAREIARLWGLAEPAVTKHLSALRSAGLVRAERAGHFVRYTLDSEVIAAVGTDLLDVLRR
ncbi:ArsR/SmtB family transcription factor [Longispora albida]|uniref:ArsR/SmtB family transcription factor n=1 Tax=Longispora albida TaxID=203523 RepID=UPI00035C1C44|nr:DUF5937 family protein [Longispora albida]